MTGAFDRPPRRGASIAVSKGDALLLVERSRAPWRGLWSLPGGSPREAASRELMEETGITAKIEGLLNTIQISDKRDDGEAVKYLLDVFYRRYAGGSPQPASDAASARWIALGDLEKLSLTEGTGALISLAARPRLAFAVKRR